MNYDCLIHISRYIKDYSTFKYFIESSGINDNTYYINFRLHSLLHYTDTFKNDIFYLAKFIQSINSSISGLNQKKYNIIYIESLCILRYVIKKNTHYISSHCIIDRHNLYQMYVYKFKNSDKKVDYYDIYIYHI